MLTLTATDTHISLRLRCAVEIEEEGSVALDSAVLSELVRSLPEEGDITVESSTGGQGDATLTTHAGSYRLRCFDSNHYPKVPEFPHGGEGAFTLDAYGLAKAISKVAPVAANDPTRPVLSSVKLLMH